MQANMIVVMMVVLRSAGPNSSPNPRPLQRAGTPFLLPTSRRFWQEWIGMSHQRQRLETISENNVDRHGECVAVDGREEQSA